MPEIRPATAADAEAFAQVFVDCWQVSYAATMPAGLVERMTSERALALWQGALRSEGDSYLVATSADGRGDVVGFVGFRMADTDAGYVSSLYVSPFAQGGGFGRLLLTAAEDGLRGLGAATARLWVFEQNEPSRMFYERLGWRLDGTRETLAEWGEPQVGMLKQL